MRKHSRYARTIKPDLQSFDEFCKKLLPPVDLEDPYKIEEFLDRVHIIYLDDAVLKKKIKTNDILSKKILDLRIKNFLKFEQKNYDKAEIIEKYRKVTEAAEKFNVDYVTAVDFFLCYLYNSGLFNAAKVVFQEDVPKSVKSFIGYFYLLGKIYFDRAVQVPILLHSTNRLELNLLEKFGPYVPDLRLALIYFKKALKRNPKNIMFCCLVAICHHYLSQYIQFNKIRKFLEKKYGSFSKSMFVNIQKELSAGSLTLFKAFMQWNQHIFFGNDHFNPLTHINLLMPFYRYRSNDRLACFMLSNDYMSDGKFREAINVLRKIRGEEPLFYYLIGRALLNMSKYYYASLYFAREIKLLSNSSTLAKYEAELLYNYAQGMWNKKNGLWQLAQKNFSYCIKLIKNKKLLKYVGMILLPQLLEIDEEIANIAMATDPQDFSGRICNSLMNLFRVISSFGIFAKKGVKSTRENLIYLLAEYKSKLLLYLLFNAFRDKTFELDFVKNVLGKLQKYKLCVLYDNLESDFKKCIDWYNDLGLIDDISIVNGIKAFTKELSGRTVLDVSNDEWTNLMASLKSFLRISSEETQQIANIYIAHVNKLEINYYIQRSAKLTENQNGLISSTVWNGSKKTKILTNVDDKEIPEIIFYPEHVTINTIPNSKLRKNRERYLFEHLILQGRLHYLHGFVIFKERGFKFSCSKFVDDPSGKFLKHISTLRGIIEDIKDKTSGEPIMVVEGPQNGYYELVEKVKFNSHIKEAKKIYEEAQEFFKKGKYEEAAKKLDIMCDDSAISKYNNYLDAYIRLAECYSKIASQSIDSTELYNVRKFLEKWDTWYCEAIEAIDKYFRMADKREFSGNEETVFNEITNKHAAVRKALSLLEQYATPRTEDDIIWDKFDKIQDIVEEYKTEEGYENTIGKLKIHGDLHEVMRDLLSNVLKRRISYLGAMTSEQKEQAESDINVKAANSFIDILRQKRYCCSNFGSFMVFISFMTYKIDKSFEPSRGPDEKKSDTMERLLRKYESMRDKRGFEHLSYKEQCKMLGWEYDTLWSVIEYLKVKKAYEHIDELDEGEETS